MQSVAVGAVAEAPSVDPLVPVLRGRHLDAPVPLLEPTTPPHPAHPAVCPAP